LGSETLIGSPAAAIGAIATHFELALDAGAIAEGPLFRRHSKTGEAYDAAQRADELRAAAATHREEIEMVVAWTGKVAEAQGIALELPSRSLL
jgi:hypothetical protein